MTNVYRVKILDDNEGHCEEDLGPFAFEALPDRGDQITLLHNHSYRSFELVRLEHQPISKAKPAENAMAEERKSQRTVLMVRFSARRSTA